MMILLIHTNHIITLRILNLNKKRPKKFALDVFGLKCCFYSYMSCEKRDLLKKSIMIACTNFKIFDAKKLILRVNNKDESAIGGW